MSEYIILESNLNNHSLEECEMMNNHAVYVYPIGVETRYRKDSDAVEYIYRDDQIHLYGGPNIHKAFEAMERHKGSILYTGI